MKRALILLLCLLTLGGCAVKQKSEQKQYTATFLEYFDTVTTVVGNAESKQDFENIVTPLRDELWHYHRLFDIYNEYSGINNLKTVNDKAAIAPVKVDSAILELLQDCKYYYNETDKVFNPAMGSVLRLWHDARNDSINDPANAYLPDFVALSEASKHMDPDNIVLDFENSTVFILDADLKIDVGAIAKGWAVEKICESAPKGLLISVGGNVYATGGKNQGSSPWSVGIVDPNADNSYIHSLNITSGSVVTSGSYHRAFTVDGKLYHHIIDPNTLYPSTYWVSVTIVTEDSGLADVLSTSLFLLEREDGQKLLDKFGAVAMWVDAENNKYYSHGFKELIRI